jgi:alpha-beta hydrolase superfamily lysophospholipase
MARVFASSTSTADQPSLKKGVVLLIHGFPETSYQFRHVSKPLSEEGYRFVVPDTTG